MATKPPVSPVKELDLRSINNAIALVNQQLIKTAQIAENAFKIAGQSAFNTNQGASSTAQLQQQIAQLQAAILVLTQGSLAPTATYRADAAITSFDTLVVTSDGGVSPVDTQDPTQIFAAFAVATSNAAIGENIVVRRSGIQVGAGVDFEAGRAVYSQVGSGLTQLPTYASVAIPVGVAINATDFEVRPSWPVLLDLPPYPGGYEDFLPVSLTLVRTMIDLLDSINGQPDGFVVKIGNVLTTRALVAGSGAGLTISNPDGVDGDPVFAVE